MINKPLLVRADAAQDASETLVGLCGHADVYFVVKWNPRRADLGDWTDQALAHGRVSQPGTGMRAAVFSTWISRHHNGKTYRVRLVIRVTESVSNPKGQMFLQPSVALEGWWTSLSLDEEQVIALDENRGLREPFPREITWGVDSRKPCPLENSPPVLWR